MPSEAPVSRLFTPLPWCFSSFPRGTSPLSDSHSYLAFDGALHRFTLRARAELLRTPAALRYGALTLSGARPPALRVPPRPYNAVPCLPPGLFPLRSPLLRESSLISSPPLTDMLKSRGSSGASRPRTPARSSDTARAPHSAPLFALRCVLPRRGSLQIPRSLSPPLLRFLPRPQASHAPLPSTDPSAGSPTETLLRLLPNLVARTQKPSLQPLRTGVHLR
jgi:hypothetical protein